MTSPNDSTAANYVRGDVLWLLSWLLPAGASVQMLRRGRRTDTGGQGPARGSGKAAAPDQQCGGQCSQPSSTRWGPQGAAQPRHHHLLCSKRTWQCLQLPRQSTCAYSSALLMRNTAEQEACCWAWQPGLLPGFCELRVLLIRGNGCCGACRHTHTQIHTPV